MQLAAAVAQPEASSVFERRQKPPAGPDLAGAVAPPAGEGGSFPLWVDVQKLCNMCVLSLSWNFFVSHDN